MNTPAKIDDLTGQKIISAQSSLDCFFMKLEQGMGLILSPNKTSGSIEVKIVKEEELPSLNEAVCAVDWSWICESKIQSVKTSSSQIAFQLSPAGPLRVNSGTWQNKPYLFFDPYKASGSHGR